MTSELDGLAPMPELRVLVELLGAQNWMAEQATQAALARAGEAGIAAAIWGLSHPSVRVRRGCAGFMDHHATDACFASLCDVALHDPAPSVRRMAVHSATCQECKPCPLTGDRVGLLVEVALSDSNRRVRLHALWGLHQPQDARAKAALVTLLRDADPHVRLAACAALLAQDPNSQGETVDVVGLHVQIALSGTDRRARLSAVSRLQWLPPDTRAVAALEQILQTESDPRLRAAAHHALKHQDPSYKAAVDARARERGKATARTRQLERD
jgi:HEAT repeat protein